MMGDVADSALRPEEAQRLLFRFGFICFSATDSDPLREELGKQAYLNPRYAEMLES